MVYFNLYLKKGKIDKELNFKVLIFKRQCIFEGFAFLRRSFLKCGVFLKGFAFLRC